MSKKLAYERYLWFHSHVRKGLYPNAAKLAEKFEISEKQAQRDIEFMRDRLYAPLSYDSSKKGYTYTNDSYELPSIWVRVKELVSLCIAYKLSSLIPDEEIKKSLSKLSEKIFNNYFAADVDFYQFINKVSIKNIEYYKVDMQIFHQIVESLLNGKIIRITYYSPHSKEQSEREIVPLNLLCYMGRWFIISYCLNKRDLRYFALSRIKSITGSDKKTLLHENKFNIPEYIHKNFGLFSGDNNINVCLKFSKNVSDWIKEQIWHEAQEIIENDDGSICLKFVASDLRELKGEILKYGADVEVISPVELKKEIKAEIEKMKNIYT